MALISPDLAELSPVADSTSSPPQVDRSTFAMVCVNVQRCPPVTHAKAQLGAVVAKPQAFPKTKRTTAPCDGRAHVRTRKLGDDGPRRHTAVFGYGRGLNLFNVQPLCDELPVPLASWLIRQIRGACVLPLPVLSSFSIFSC